LYNTQIEQSLLYTNMNQLYTNVLGDHTQLKYLNTLPTTNKAGSKWTKLD